MESVTTDQKYRTRQIIAFFPGMTDFQRLAARTRGNSAYGIGQEWNLLSRMLSRVASSRSCWHTKLWSRCHGTFDFTDPMNRIACTVTSVVMHSHSDVVRADLSLKWAFVQQEACRSLFSTFYTVQWSISVCTLSPCSLCRSLITFDRALIKREMSGHGLAVSQSVALVICFGSIVLLRIESSASDR